ncbi:MAG: SpoIIE family protein phosphatase [Oligoflexia bacterium]|nr:SpoIIE family protein phosphatase [Oligoflexia bacterium]
MTQSHPVNLSSINVTVLAGDRRVEESWAQRLQAGSKGWFDLRLSLASDQKIPGTYGQVVFVDSLIPDLQKVLSGLERKGRAVFLLVSENALDGNLSGLASIVSAGQADDVLVYPFRALELFGRLRHYQQLLMWDEVQKLNASFSDLLGQLKDDIDLAGRLQKAKAPVRFPDVKGFKAASRYLAGLRSGGDYFDLAESASGNQLSVVLSDSSSYGLSSAVLSVLMRVAMKLSAEEVRSCEETVRRIREEILATLHERDRLSLFYGVISRKDYVLRYLNLGSAAAFYAPPGKDFSVLPVQGEPITRKMLSGPAYGTGRELALEPEGRLALISDGFVEAAQGTEKALQILNEHRKREAADAINELVFRVKSKFASVDDMPAQDCTAVILDIDARVLRQV